MAIFTRKNGQSENVIYDWMIFLELNYADNSNLLCSKQSHLYYLFKEPIFVKIG